MVYNDYADPGGLLCIWLEMNCLSSWFTHFTIQAANDDDNKHTVGVLK